MSSPDFPPAFDPLAHIDRLLHSQSNSDPLPAHGGDARLTACHNTIVTLRHVLRCFARGELREPIGVRGPLAGSLKAIQANMLHVTWQIQQVADGDFTQRVDFMGDFSAAFNRMVVQLDTALTELKRSKKELEDANAKLATEAEKREAALDILKESEARFKYLADHDPLTGVYNRRSFFKLAEMELNRCRLAGEYCCIGLLDIDKFKAFNDRYGHPEGDKALRHVGATGRTNLRAGDIMGRYGGEEFVFLFVAGDAEAGSAAAERIREAISAVPVTIDSGKRVTITASMGLVCISPDFAGAHDRRLLRRAVRAADDALYAAKKDGRDRLRAALLSCAPAIAEEAGAADEEENDDITAGLMTST